MWEVTNNFAQRWPTLKLAVRYAELSYLQSLPGSTPEDEARWAQEVTIIEQELLRRDIGTEREDKELAMQVARKAERESGWTMQA